LLVDGARKRDQQIVGIGIARLAGRIEASVSFYLARAREEQCLPADPARSALARSLRTSDL
jgi:hypothetical protein